MFELVDRVGLVVYITSRRVVRVLRHYGQIRYVSRRFHYVVMYVDQPAADRTIKELNKLRNVSRIETTKWQELNPDVAGLGAAVATGEEE